MNVIITGADGFFGQRLCTRLASLGHQVIATSRRGGIDKPGVRFVPFDLSSTASPLQDVLPEVDALIHLAWGASPSTSNRDPYADFLANTCGSVRLFDACAKAGVKRLVFASSGGQVYGDLDSDMISETASTNPKSAYGAGKLSCEKYLSIFNTLSDMSTISLRVSNLYGPGQPFKDGFGVIPTFLHRLKNSLPITIFGDGANIRDFLYIDDAVEAFVQAITAKKEGALNISSGVGISVLDVIRLLEKETGLHGELTFSPARESDPRAVILDNSLARASLDWNPETRFSDGLSQTIIASNQF